MDTCAKNSSVRKWWAILHVPEPDVENLVEAGGDNGSDNPT
ncbi:MAG: hypothetical protein OEM39_04040 [Acidimicrobiia bacterium]|nr:hypothetical protein [Acidimicrobiia bacterium]MDH3463917.1 hypothetical protein [Acidimicrobiia bacterium]